MQTKGHSAANPGLRGHSCGDTYPLMVVPFGTADYLRYRVENLKTGSRGEIRHTYHEAWIDLIQRRIYTMANG